MDFCSSCEKIGSAIVGAYIEADKLIDPRMNDDTHAFVIEEFGIAVEQRFLEWLFPGFDQALFNIRATIGTELEKMCPKTLISQFTDSQQGC